MEKVPMSLFFFIPMFLLVLFSFLHDSSAFLRAHLNQSIFLYPIFQQYSNEPHFYSDFYS